MFEANASPKPTLLSRWRAWRRSLSLAAKASWLVFGILVLLVATIWTIYFLDRGNLPYRDWMSWSRMLATAALVIVIPVVTYYALRLWLQGDAARFPDIDYAWHAGMEALRRSGLSLEGAPLFLVTGCGSPLQIRQLMAATGMSFRVAGEASGPLSWYANPDGIWLFCCDVGWHSALAKLAERKISAGTTFTELPVEPASGVILPERARTDAVSATPVPASPPPVATAAARAPQPQGRVTDSTKGTILLDQFVLQQAAPPPAPAPTATIDTTRGSGQGTVMLQSPIARAPLAERVVGPSAAGQQPAIVPPQDAAEQTLRLEYLCQLLRVARQPLCGANGILTLLPFEQLLATAPEIEETQRAIKLDLLTIQRGLGLRCPVSALVTGMDRERGFRELVRRVGPERAFAQRFGRRYDLRAESSPDALMNFAAHVGGVFEDWIYTLFRENQALSRPGNTRLYGLLCKMRCHVKPRLAEVLAGGFGYDQRQTPHDDPFLFSGCYFASIGESADLQAFVKGVAEKCIEEQENVEWTRAALADEQRAFRLIYGGAAIAIALGLGLAGLIMRRWF